MPQLNVWDLVLARQKALLASVDAIPELRHAGVHLIAGGRQLRLRESHHASGLRTVVVINYSERPPEALGGALLQAMMKFVVDHAFHGPNGGSMYDAALAMGDHMIAQPVRETVRRPDFTSAILPKLVGVGLAGLGLVVAIPAVFAAAGVGTMVLALGGVGAAAAGLSAAVGMLYHQLTNPKLMELMDNSPEFARFQAQLEVFGLATGISAKAIELARAGLLKCLRTQRVLHGYKAMGLDDVIARVERLSDAQFEELGKALCGARMRQTGHFLSDVERLRAGANGLHLGQKLPALLVQEHWVASCRRRFYEALFKDARTLANHFVGDGGNLLGLASSAMPSSIVGSATSGLMNKPFEAAIQATADAMMGLTYYVAQAGHAAAASPHATARYEKVGT